MLVTLDLVMFTGVLAGFFFILNFLTCHSMPWANKCPIPHKCPGKDKCNYEKTMLCNYHHPLAWLTIGSGAVHIIISIAYIL